MQVSEATMADLPGMCELLAILFAQEAEFSPDRQRQEAGLRAILEHADVGKVLVLRDGEMLAGMVSLLYLPSTALGGRVALLEDMVVRPAYRGRGAGSQLLREATAQARAAGCLRITLLTDGDNEAGQRFYEKHGFTLSAMTPMRLMMNV